MKILTKQIVDYLESNKIEYLLTKSTQKEYEIATFYKPVNNGFYYFLGSKDDFVFSKKNSLIITSTKISVTNNSTIIIKENPKEIFYKMISFYFNKKPTGIIAKTAIISPNAKIGTNVQIDDFCIIGDCKIEANTIIGPYTRIHNNTHIEKNVTIETNSDIGARGVGWIWSENQDKRIVQPQLGGVHIKKNSFLGSNTIIVRGASNESSIIGESTLIAPGCRLGHGTIIGDFVHLANNVITGGYTKIGNYCFIGSNTTFRPAVKIHDFSIVGAGALVIKNTTKKYKTLMGVPAKEFTTKEKPKGMPELKKTK